MAKVIKVEVFASDNTAYLTVRELTKGQIVATTLSVTNNVMLDLDEEGRLLGVELLNANDMSWLYRELAVTIPAGETVTIPSDNDCPEQ